MLLRVSFVVARDRLANVTVTYRHTRIVTPMVTSTAFPSGTGQLSSFIASSTNYA